MVQMEVGEMGERKRGRREREGERRKEGRKERGREAIIDSEIYMQASAIVKGEKKKSWVRGGGGGREGGAGEGRERGWGEGREIGREIGRGEGGEERGREEGGEGRREGGRREGRGGEREGGGRGGEERGRRREEGKYFQFYYNNHTHRLFTYIFISNKDSDPEKYALKLKLHNEGVNSCQYSEDGEKVLSCAGTEVKVCCLLDHYTWSKVPKCICFS